MALPSKIVCAACGLAVALIGGYLVSRPPESTPDTKAQARTELARGVAAAVPAVEAPVAPPSTVAPDAEVPGTAAAAAATGGDSLDRPSHTSKRKVRVSRSRRHGSKSHSGRGRRDSGVSGGAIAGNGLDRSPTRERGKRASQRAETLAQLATKVDALRYEANALDGQVADFEQDMRQVSSRAEARRLNERKQLLAARAEEVEQHADTLRSEVARARR